MSLRQLGLIAVAAMVLIGGVAAVGAASPADQANENATDAYEANAPEDAVDASGEADDDAMDGADDAALEDANDADGMSEERAGNADSVGPSGGLPAQVPDHVSEIHETIESYLDGSIDDLGQALNNLLGDNGAAGNAGSENGSNAGV